jgi:hypothetical protein
METKMALDLTFNSIPAGIYPGTTSDIRFHDGDYISLIPTFSINHQGRVYTVSDFLPLDAPINHPRYNDTARGKGFVLNLLGPDPKIKDLDDLARKLMGLKVRVVIETKKRNGLLVPKIASVSLADVRSSEKSEG